MTQDKDSLVEMLAKIPITETRGSLLSSIGKLLRVIDVSESSIMIPTLLKDKYEFDANEMLVLAKILKASILGHNDLVEFYMSESSSHQSTTSSPVNTFRQHHVAHPLSSNSSSTSSQNNNNNNHHHHHHHHHHQHRSHFHQHAHLNNLNHNHIQSLARVPYHCSSCNNQHQNYSKQMVDSNYSYSQLQNQLMLQSATPSLRSSNESTPSSPSTPLPSQSSDSHSVSSSGQAQQLMLNNGDPDATLRLLMHIEQLKIFIPQVTSLFESIIELYRESVETN